MPDDMKIELGGKTYAVVLPKRHAERRELATTWANANGRGAGAILAMCVPSLEMLRVVPSRMEGLDPGSYSYDWYDFGADALEVLIGRGYNDVDIVRASVPIFNAIAAMLPVTKTAVEEARDFSKANAGP